MDTKEQEKKEEECLEIIDQVVEIQKELGKAPNKTTKKELEDKIDELEQKAEEIMNGTEAGEPEEES